MIWRQFDYYRRTAVLPLEQKQPRSNKFFMHIDIDGCKKDYRNSRSYTMVDHVIIPYFARDFYLPKLQYISLIYTCLRISIQNCLF